MKSRFCKAMALSAMMYVGDALAAPDINGLTVMDRLSPAYKGMNAVGIVNDATGKDIGDGWAAGPCLFVHDNHRAVRRTGQIGDVLYFSAGQTDNPDRPFQYTNVRGVVVATGGYDNMLGSANSDWEVVATDEPIGNEVGYLRMSQVPLERVAGFTVFTGGFHRNPDGSFDEIQKMKGDAHCHLLNMTQYGFFSTDCRLYHGNSGDPIVAFLPFPGLGMTLYAVAMADGLADPSNPSIVARFNRAVGFTSGLRSNMAVKYVSEGDKLKMAIHTFNASNAAQKHACAKQ